MKKIFFILLLASNLCQGQVSNSCTTTNFLTKSDANGNLSCSSIFDDGTTINIGYPIFSNGSVNIGRNLNIKRSLYVDQHMFLMRSATNLANNFLWFINEAKPNGSQFWIMGSTTTNGGLGASDGLSFIEGLGGNGAYQTRLFLQDGTGKVGIGTTNLSCATCNDYLLFVKNGIKTERVKVEIASTNNWADYVFEEDYNLKPLEEVEAFIKENKHLPEIPSAAEVVENGIELGEMNKLLLQKVEELTLYLIEQDKAIKKQSEEIAELKEMMKNKVEKN